MTMLEIMLARNPKLKDNKTLKKLKIMSKMYPCQFYLKILEQSLIIVCVSVCDCGLR